MILSNVLPISPTEPRPKKMTIISTASGRILVGGTEADNEKAGGNLRSGVKGADLCLVSGGALRRPAGGRDMIKSSPFSAASFDCPRRRTDGPLFRANHVLRLEYMVFTGMRYFFALYVWQSPVGPPHAGRRPSIAFFLSVFVYFPKRFRMRALIPPASRIIRC